MRGHFDSLMLTGPAHQHNLACLHWVVVDLAVAMKN